MTWDTLWLKKARGQGTGAITNHIITFIHWLIFISRFITILKAQLTVKPNCECTTCLLLISNNFGQIISHVLELTETENQPNHAKELTVVVTSSLIAQTSFYQLSSWDFLWVHSVGLPPLLIGVHIFGLRFWPLVYNRWYNTMLNYLPTFRNHTRNRCLIILIVITLCVVSSF